MNMSVARMPVFLPKRLPHRFFCTTKSRAAISAIVFVFILSIGFVFFVYPQKQNLAQLMEEVTATEQEVRTKQNTVIQQQQLLERQQQLQQVLNAFYITKPDYLVTTQLITQIEQWSKQQGLQLQKVTLGELKQQEHLIIQPVNLRFIGTYFQLMSLFQYLGESYAVIDIVDFTMQKQMAQVSSHVSLTLKLHIVILTG